MVFAGALALGAVPAHAACQNFKGLPLVEIKEQGRDRLNAWAEALAPVVKGRDVVMLGEPSHGDGASIRVRSEIVEVLYKRFGFDVLIFEGDFYGLTFGWQSVKDGNAIASFARGNLYSFWSNTPAADPLWTFIQRTRSRGQSFDIAGMDVRLRGELSRAAIPGELSRVAASEGIAISPPALRGLADLLHSDLKPSAAVDERAALRSVLEQLLGRGLSNDADRAIIQSLLYWAKFAWQDASRDEGMAANLRWLVDHRFPGRKVIVWAHSNHELRNASVWDRIADPAPRHMGNLFAEGREDQVAVIGTIADGGVITSSFPKALDWRDFDINETVKIPSHAVDSVESYLAEKCNAPTILRLPRTGATPHLTASAIDHFYEKQADYAKAFDALVFVGPAKSLNLVRPK